jgi:uracil-DNA glycosylase family 4
MIELGDKNCTNCRQHQGADDVCVMGRSPGWTLYADDDDEKWSRPIMVVTSRPNSETFQKLVEGHLKDAGFNTALIHFTSAIKCRNFEMSIGKKDIAGCKPWLLDEIREVNPQWILVMGNEALQSVTGHSGIMKYRAKVLQVMTPSGSRKVVPTISPAAVSRNPGQKASYMGDLRFFHNQVYEKTESVKIPKIQVINTAQKFKKLKRAIGLAELIYFDVETTRTPYEGHPDSRVISLSGTMVVNGKVVLWALPLYHPQSPFRRDWEKALRQLVPLMQRVRYRLAHNGKFDCRYLTHYGQHPINITFDTMLAAHLLDENREKGLKPQATSRLGVAPWGIDTNDLTLTPLAEVLEYNALDTWYGYQIYLQLRKQLQEQPRLLRIFKTITMPAANKLISVEMRGAWVSREKLATNGKIARDMRDEIEKKIRQHLPKPTSKKWPVDAKGRPREINFNRSIFALWFLFEHCELPVLARGKPKEDGRPGDPSMAEDVLLELQGEHPVVDLMLERAMWNQLVKAFFNAYDELLDDNDRIHTTFKIAGTVTGRLSSGKEDKEKFSARAPVRGVNLQQVPRDTLVRGLFGAPPGYTFVEADFSQIELRIAAYLSRDRTMLSLYQQGEDIHAATASWVLGVPKSQVTKDDRKKAKAVNFGFVYGMGWRKFIYTAFTKYGLRFTEEEAQGIRRSFFEQFRGLQAWHARQRRLVHENRRVQNPIGRVRHLPDIDSPEQGVRAEAERQAINSPVQSFGSDLCMLSMIEIDRKLTEQAIIAHTIGTVHDALLFEVKDEHLGLALPVIKGTMENLPLERKFGVTVDVPIVADIKVGPNWGEGAIELTEDQVYGGQDALRRILQDAR